MDHNIDDRRIKGFGMSEKVAQCGLFVNGVAEHSTLQVFFNKLILMKAVQTSRGPVHQYHMFNCVAMCCSLDKMKVHPHTQYDQNMFPEVLIWRACRNFGKVNGQGQQIVMIHIFPTMYILEVFRLDLLAPSEALVVIMV